MKTTVTILMVFAFTISAFSQVPANWEGKVMTVNGLIPADSMGITLPHEHLLIVHTFDFLNLTNEEDAITELGYYINAGGKTLAEASVIGIGRNPEGLKRISTATGANIIMSAGYYKDLWIHDSLKSKSVEQLTEIIINDIINGINGIHAGFIKIGVSRLITPFEEKVLIAAAHAQKATGAAIDVHFDGHRATTQDRHHVLDVFENEGVDLTRVYLSHFVPYVDLVDDYITLAQRGCYLSFDMTGIEVVVYFEREQKLAETLKSLIDAGYLEQLLISQDVCFTKCYIKNGGYGYAHILNDILPLLKAKGITDDQIHTIMVENPKQVFPFKSYTNAGQCVNSTYTATTGTISDNSGASDYPNDMSCSKLIQPLNCSSVILTFTKFNTESANDVLTVYDGPTTSSPLLGQFSGSTLPPVLESTGGSMLIVFNTNGIVTDSGWKANYYGKINTDYSGPCLNELFTAESGTITDNSGSSDYSYYLSCQKLIEVPGSTAITLQFTSFATEAGFDFVKIYDGATTSSPLLGEYSGTSLPPVLNSTGGSMLILFFTNGEIQAAGWSANYTSNNTSTGNCVNETFTAMTGTITDNSGSANYNNSMSCQKLIQASGAVNVTLTFNSFETENGYDFVKVYDGATTSSPLLGQYSGTLLPPVLTSTGGSMLIVFTTDHGVVAAGWSATYTGNPTSTYNCVNEVFTAMTGTITDNSGSADYNNNMSCQKLIQPSGIANVTLAFNSFATESGYDFVKVYDGATTSSPLLGQFSGTSLPAAVSSTGASMLIVFSTDHGVVAAGWSATYTGNAPALSVTPESRSISPASGTITFTVTSNIDWSVSESSVWLTATKTDATTLTVSYDENTSVDSRSAEITISGAGVTSLNNLVNQSGASPTLNVTPESISVSSAPGTTTFTVTSNIDWSVSVSSGWLTATKTDDTTLTVSYDENTSVDSRSAEITVSGAGVTSLNNIVNQSGASPTLNVTPESISLSSAPGTITFTVTSNIDWSVSESSGWLTATKTDAATLTVSYVENTSIDSLLAEITVSGAGITSRNIVIKQHGASPTLGITPESRSISSSSGTTTFTVTSNIEWSVSESSGWLEAIKTADTTLTVIYGENTSADSRNAGISVSGAGVNSQLVSILQEGAIPSTIKHTSEIQQINVFPNPVSNKTLLAYPKGTTELIEIYQPSGRLIIRLQDSDKNGVTEIDFSGLNSGLYIYRLIDQEGNIYNGKILKE